MIIPLMMVPLVIFPASVLPLSVNVVGCWSDIRPVLYLLECAVVVEEEVRVVEVGEMHGVVVRRDRHMSMEMGTKLFSKRLGLGL